MITPTQHEKDEWSRMAQDAYRTGRNDLGHRYSMAAAIRHGGRISTFIYDTLRHYVRLREEAYTATRRPSFEVITTQGQ